MVTFEKPPTDKELWGFVAPQESSSSVRLLHAGPTLTARPQPMPMWFFLVCLLVPDAVIVGSLVWMNPFAAADPFTRVWGHLVAGSIPVVTVLTWVLIRELIRREVERGDFFILDRLAVTLTLPRAGVTLHREELVELIEVRGWHRVGPWNDRSSSYLRELSVLARGLGGGLVQYSVLIAGHGKPVSRAADELAAAFGVPRRTLAEAIFHGGWRRLD